MSTYRPVLAALLVVSLVAGSSVAVAAQGDEVTPAAGVNADRVDGKHAVSATGKAKQRAGKLVATNKQGLLPSNILRPIWSLIQGMPAAFADGQIAFGEITGMPAGFADGVDDGITGMTLTVVVGPNTNLATNANGTATATCPAGRVPVSGGHTASSFLVFNVSSFRSGNGWIVAARNTAATAQTLTPYVNCLATVPSTAVSIAKKTGEIKAATAKNKPPVPKKRSK
ncbi:MAG: hypothetical protein R6W93_08640 [Candidatus Limnocylindrales bacterium]